MTREMIAAANELFTEGKSFALATIVTQKGNTPRHTGAQMLVRPDGSIAGTIGGGLVEATARQRGAEVIATACPHLMEFEMKAGSAAEEGMACGGEVEIWIDYVDGGDMACREVYRALGDIIQRRKKAWHGFYLPEPGQDPGQGMACRQCLILADGSVTGPFLGEPGLLHKMKGYDVFTLSETTRMYLQPLGADGRVLIFGAGHVGEKLAPVVKSAGFEVVVMDDRGDFANAQRFPDADEIRVLGSFQDDLFGGLGDLSATYCVILTRGHLHDKEVLVSCLKTDARYIGMIGSRKKTATVFAALREEGFNAGDIARCYAPIGLKIGAETPEEIAVSIAGELIAVRALGHGFDGR